MIKAGTSQLPEEPTILKLDQALTDQDKPTKLIAATTKAQDPKVTLTHKVLPVGNLHTVKTTLYYARPLICFS